MEYESDSDEEQIPEEYKEINLKLAQTQYEFALRNDNIDNKLSFRYYLMAANKGYIPAQLRLAKKYHKGVGTDKNIKKAFYYYELVAKQGLVDVQYYVGMSYISGVEIDRDYKMAAYYFKLAAGQGHKKSQNNLAVCYEYGIGIEKDRNLAMEHYKKAGFLAFGGILKNQRSKSIKIDNYFI